MQTTTRVAVIGGGVVGASVLYHLTKLGWSDVMLIERSELTSGSTWHAAGGFHTLNGDTNMAALQGYTIRLYKVLEAITGMSCGLHHVGGITLADNRDRFDMLLAERAKHRFMGLETEIVTPDEIARIAPVTNIDGIIGGLYDPLDGHLDPSGTTHAYAKAARMGGATIQTHTMVTETNQRPDGTWDVVTDKGTIHAEHIVNAGGLWAREVGAMAGIYFPLHPMEHQYIVTEEVPMIADIVNAGGEHPHVMDPAGESYLRQEGRGLCIGFYEQRCRPWAVNGTPWTFGHELLPDDFDKIEDSIAFAYKRFPALETAGVKSVIHGPFTFAPDGNPLVGPVPGVRNYWSACGVMAGFSQGGGVGLTLAQWMIEGEPERDVMAMDVARFGDWISPGYTLPKVIENYQKRFSVSYPNEELPAARPNRTTPMYDIFSDMGAVWGQQYGLEVVNYFAQEGEPSFETPSFRRSDAFDATAREVRGVRGGVGINEVHNFGKYRVTGPRARAWLDRIMAGRVPQPGRLSLTPMLSDKGKLIGDFTISCLSAEEFQLTASYGSQNYHFRRFSSHLEDGVHVENISDKRTGFQIAGPKARAVLAACTRTDVSDMKFRDVRRMTVGMTDCIVQRVSYTGDLGYEIYCDPMGQRALWWTLWAAGQPHGMVPFGMRAMMSLRLDKHFGSWMAEFSPDYTAAETGLDRFIDFKKGTDFIGRAAAEAERVRGTTRRLVALAVDADDADVHGYEPIWLDGEVVGFCTSGGYSHHTGTSIAQGFLPRQAVSDGLKVEIEILGQMRPATVTLTPPFDADGARMRG
ncbi:FAD-dependent oxidoreductase [Sulfitobacter pseudonitzschiae]|uniref:FAD-dependent oxidoreductase n=1 Tax=Pseudosulfitobacter pseudonitzschiae TaxID=1402135 RepID=A0A9Q2RWB5_9RHOB|nr:FAD-dependent oxidoreductase [Pseudosulfitobacter pseudonitzschiae]MBM2292817.1 FAD-dependent oxidoreductase [Pseudosulfitobacter pseudonitzschiae]MBM2298087.1 FAD-dependent oxidoreductase [Pseudosulfitobacter pseudonitzschiae]MBM2303001.1 FAD-dependent oxidoreductase [Pseudosulfitobacter pseudonitzschiae]MBM2312784.1 FAD-dependent oxidoreductase [Pseudosulfitobacter pseudonitzschiae]MBM2317697.1 FAD-dependent oxidoreductase [Pseudosulfitobacter pseudonitzschiae]